MSARLDSQQVTGSRLNAWNSSMTDPGVDDRPVKIHTLGRFSIQLNGAALPLAQGRKHRTLELLKALIALGGREVHADLLCEALWPDADGDTAQNSFDVTLHRLRKVFGIRNLLTLCDRRLTLNSDLAWVDVWQFEKLVNHSERLLRFGSSPDVIGQLIDCNDHLLQLYQGAFLEREAVQNWSLGLSERLRSKLLRHTIDTGRVCESRQQWDEAIRLYQKGLEVDPLIEQLHLRLMTCYRNSGRIAEAIGAYYHCRDLLTQHLHVEPARATVELYQTMRS